MTDDFNRSNSSDLGENWSEQAGDWQIYSQTLRNASAGGDVVVAYAGEYGDVEASIKARFTSADGTVSIGVRLGSYVSGVPAAGYIAEISETGLVILWRVSDWAELGSYQIPGFEAGDFTTLLISADGDALRVDVDGTTRISANDNTFGSGAVGLWSYDATAANQHVFDDFTLADLTQSHAPSWNLARVFAQARDWLGSLLGGVRLAALVPLNAFARQVDGQVEGRSLAVEVPEGQVWKNYILLGGQKVVLREHSAVTSEVYFLLADHLGSTHVVASATGAALSEIRYSAYGEERYASGATPTDYRYTGQLSKMPSVGLYFYRARWYDPALGRFIQADTIVPEAVQGVQAWDRFAYANNSPFNYTDPTGHFIAPAVILAVFFVAAVTLPWISRDTPDPQKDLESNPEETKAELRLRIDATMMILGGGVSIASAAAMVPEAAMYTGAQTNNVNMYSWGAAQNGLLPQSQTTITYGTPAATSKNPPNPSGRLGSVAHQNKITEIDKSVVNVYGSDYKGIREYKINTPGGQNSYRYVDLAVIDVTSEKPVGFYQVGISTLKGMPLARERYAIDDIYNFGLDSLGHYYNVPITFIPYK